MEYKMHVKEIDDYTDYPIDVLMGLTGLGKNTIEKLINEGKLTGIDKNGLTTINGKEFLEWSSSVNQTIDVEKTYYSKMKVDE
ncbi:MerR family transcriptional regulator [Litchfieldia salsa]|uniref:Helix-turn-helix domain-containing protein n=1 Tax=Litchfieldia salsa TaxID=930152 RepID=A0A1H0RP96_9BACI|nr:DNA-binding protein [Litchfieldia salsa]SDP31225.1 hypothetical protein SAMN05216565_102316 [Litchfieldia salsa]